VNALTRRSRNRSNFEEDDHQKHQHQIILLIDKLDKEVRSNLHLLSEMNELFKDKILVFEQNRLKVIQEIYD
jgi:hypothetical protein